MIIYLKEWYNSILLWYISFIFLSKDDISRYKSATQLHTAAGPNQYAASNAVDGDIATCMRTKDIGTSSPDNTVWWKVDFGGVFNIYRINIMFKEYDKSVGVYHHVKKPYNYPAQNMHNSYHTVVWNKIYTSCFLIIPHINVFIFI